MPRLLTGIGLLLSVLGLILCSHSSPGQQKESVFTPAEDPAFMPSKESKPENQAKEAPPVSFQGFRWNGRQSG